ncbi:hypothetical protein [Holospora obtusa]|nr:hypothetical protein [Holospora obtusa]
MKILLLCLLSFSAEAHKNTVTIQKESSEKPVLVSEPLTPVSNAEKFLSAWTVLSNPEVSLQELEQSSLLTLRDWTGVLLSDFQNIPDFKYANSLEDVKKIIFNKLLVQKNITPIRKFLIQNSIPGGWCDLLKYITTLLWDPKKSSKGLTIQEISALLSLPLSNLKCETLKLPVPEKFLDAFMHVDESRLEQEENGVPCLISLNETENKGSSSEKSYTREPVIPQERRQEHEFSENAKKNPVLTENTYKNSKLEDPVSTYVDSSKCLEFWTTSIIEQSMHAIKKAPNVWLSLFNSANTDPMTQKVVQYCKQLLNDDHSSYSFYQDSSYSSENSDSQKLPQPSLNVISASSSGVNKSGKIYTDPDYLGKTGSEPNASEEPKIPLEKRKTVTFFSKLRHK